MIKKFLGLLTSKKWLVLPPILLGIVIVAAFALSRKELPRTDPVEEILSLPVMEIQASSFTPWATGFGTANPGRIWSAVTEVKGRIVDSHTPLDSGKRVKANELLFKIDDSDYRLRLAQRNSDLNSMKAKLAELVASEIADKESVKIAEELLDVTKDEIKRIQRLDQGNAVSQREVDAARSSLLQQSQSVQNLRNSLSLYPSKIAFAEASIALAKSQAKEAQRDIDRTTIKSPFDGVLSGVNLETDQIVGQNQRLFEVHDDQTVEIEAQFTLAQLEKISPQMRERINSLAPTSSLIATDVELLAGLTASVVTRSGNLTHRWTGKAIRISESVNQKTRTLGIVIEVNNPSSDETDTQTDANCDEPTSIESTGVKTENVTGQQYGQTPTLRPGSFCEVTLIGQPIRDAITVPRTAIDGNVVYTIDDNNRLQPKRIEIGNAYGEQVQIVAGLSTGDLVAVAYPVPAIKGKLTDPKIVDLGQAVESAAVDQLPEKGHHK